MEGKSIIIKKVVKKGHGGGHGGSWKVAYADFVTAMMAFFLLLWLITMVSPEKKAKVSHYFRYFSIFEKSGTTLLDLQKSQPPVVGATVIPELRSEDEIKGVTEATAQFQQKMSEELKKKLAEFKDQIAVEPIDGGLRVELMEKEGSPMFPSGTSELTPDGRRMLQVITETLQKSKAKIAIEGHTDARAFASNHRYSNWELSTERASAARKELERNGVGADRIVRITGYAATQPMVRDNPLDPRNRRISILVFGEPGQPAASTDPLDSLGLPSTGKGAGSRLPQTRQKIPQGNFQFDPVEQYLKGGTKGKSS